MDEHRLTTVPNEVLDVEKEKQHEHLNQLKRKAEHNLKLKTEKKQKIAEGEAMLAILQEEYAELVKLQGEHDQEVAAALAEVIPNINTLVKEVFTTDTRSLIYSFDRKALPDPVSRQQHTWRQNYGCLQMMSNPLYMTDRLFQLVMNMESEADLRWPVGLEMRQGDEAAIKNARICGLVMNLTPDNVSDAVHKASLAHFLFEHLQSMEMPDNQEILATRNVGSRLDPWVKRYKVGILAVIPIYELMVLSGTTTISIVQEDYLQWIQAMILGPDPESEAEFREREPLPLFLAKLVDFLDEFIEYNTFKWRLKDGYRCSQFRSKFRALREGLGLPATRIFFELPTSAHDLLSWEKATSISGWNDEITDAISVVDAAGETITINNPAVMLAEIYGHRTSADDDNGITNLVPAPMSKTTLEAATRLLISPVAVEKMANKGIGLEFVGVDQSIKIQDTKGAKQGTRQVICLVQLKTVWVVLVLGKDEAPPSEGRHVRLDRQFDRVLVVHPQGDVGNKQVSEALDKLDILVLECFRPYKLRGHISTVLRIEHGMDIRRDCSHTRRNGKPHTWVAARYWSTGVARFCEFCLRSSNASVKA